MQLLIERGADVNIKTKDGKTAMDFAIKNGQEETAAFLREVMKSGKDFAAAPRMGH